jgi:hypothetical protein
MVFIIRILVLWRTCITFVQGRNKALIVIPNMLKWHTLPLIERTSPTNQSPQLVTKPQKLQHTIQDTSSSTKTPQLPQRPHCHNHPGMSTNSHEEHIFICTHQPLSINQNLLNYSHSRNPRCAPARTHRQIQAPREPPN